MQRALAGALIAKGKTIVTNPGYSRDDMASLELIKALGAKTELVKGELIIESKGIGSHANSVNCGESGLGIRMFAPIIGLSEKEITVNGEGSLLGRPMHFFDEVLPQLGVQVISNNGKLPLKIRGPLVPRNITIDGSLSSQFLTGLLMAYSAAGAKDVSIKVKDLKSKPYIDLTLGVMSHFGLNVPVNDNYKEFSFHNSTIPVEKKIINYRVEGDWSGGAFLLVAGAIAGSITVTGLDMMSAQADKAILAALMSANAGLALEAKGIRVRSLRMTGFEFEAGDCPDLFPPLVALAVHCVGTSVIKGTDRLKHKESDRAISLQQEFSKMGVNIKTVGNTMIIEGGRLKPNTISSHHDHRIAMGCAIAALRAEGITVIENAEAINKSYPDFFWDLKKLGADIILDKMMYS